MLSQAFRWDASLGLTTVSPVDSGSTVAYGLGINAAGVLVGYEFAPDFSFYRAFLNDGGSSTYIPLLPGYSSNTASGVNDTGVIVGTATTTGGTETAFRYASGTADALGSLPGGTRSRASAINAAGIIAGASDSALDARLRPAIYDGLWVDLGLPTGHDSGEALAISSDGRVAETLLTAGGDSMAFLWSQVDGYMLLGALSAGAGSSVLGVNSAGNVVGVSDGTAFLFESGALFELNSRLVDAGWQITSANAINDAGQVAGTGIFDGQQRAVLLTPTPEPAGSSMVLGPLAALLLATWRSRRK